MKKTLALILATFLLGTSIFPVDAIASEGYDGIDIIEQISISDEGAKMLSEIPIYLTYINNYNVDGMDYIKESVSLQIDEVTKDKSNDLLSNKINKPIHIIKDEYELIEVEESSKMDVITDPLYTSIFVRVQELIDQGTKVNNVNIFVKSPDTMVLSNDPNDPAYWESSYPSLGTYGSYKFLFMEASTNVGSSWVVPGNIGVSVKWNEITKKTLEAILDHYVKDNFYRAVKAVSSGLSTFFNAYQSPLSITYSSSGGELKAKVSGNLYIRTVLIRDRLNRVPGYAYYGWGTTEQFKTNLKIDAMWPVSVRPGGTYDYATGQHTFPTQNSNTPGFYGNQTLFISIIDFYENAIGYFTHDEYINVNSIVARLLN